jgi:heme exporter protein D
MDLGQKQVPNLNDIFRQQKRQQQIKQQQMEEEEEMEHGMSM